MPKKKTKKQIKQDAKFYSWFCDYRTRVKLWRKRLRRKGKAEKIDRYVSNSGVFHINLPTLSSKIAYGYSDCRTKTKNTKMMKRDMTEALPFNVKLLLERGNQYACLHLPHQKKVVVAILQKRVQLMTMVQTLWRKTSMKVTA